MIGGRARWFIAFGATWAIALGTRWDAAIFCLPLAVWAALHVGWRWRLAAATVSSRAAMSALAGSAVTAKRPLERVYSCAQ